MSRGTAGVARVAAPGAGRTADLAIQTPCRKEQNDRTAGRTGVWIRPSDGFDEIHAQRLRAHRSLHPACAAVRGLIIDAPPGWRRRS